MFEVIINKKTYQHPSRLQEVKLQQFIEITKPSDENDPMSELKSYSRFSGIPLKDLEKAPMSDVNKQIENTKRTLSSIEFVKDMETPTKIKIGRNTYYVAQDLDGAPMAQYIDCTHYMKSFGSNLTAFYPYMMAIYCLKKGEEYNFEGNELEERADIMRKCFAVDAISINAFFLTGSEVYARDFLHYSQANPLRKV